VDVGASFTVPSVGSVPDQAPDAVQVGAFVVTIVSVVDDPSAISVGEALKVTVGAPGATTLTEVDATAFPPGPVQEISYVIVPVAVGVIAELPFFNIVPRHEPPEGAHEEAFVDDQESVVHLPSVVVVGAALKVAVGKVAVVAVEVEAGATGVIWTLNVTVSVCGATVLPSTVDFPAKVMVPVWVPAPRPAGLTATFGWS
jgi:hypothetical protein